MYITYKAEKIAKYKYLKKGMMASAFHPSIYEQKQVHFCEFEASLVYNNEFQVSQGY